MYSMWTKYIICKAYRYARGEDNDTEDEEDEGQKMKQAYIK